jgi:hypothetical protein
MKSVQSIQARHHCVGTIAFAAVYYTTSCVAATMGFPVVV